MGSDWVECPGAVQYLVLAGPDHVRFLVFTDSHALSTERRLHKLCAIPTRPDLAPPKLEALCGVLELRQILLGCFYMTSLSAEPWPTPAQPETPKI